MKQWERQDSIAFLRSIGVREGHSLLDFGCRVGHYSIPAAFAVGRSGIVYALDKDPKPLDELMKKAGKYGLQNIKAIRTSGQFEIDIESRSIDIALLYDVLHYFTRSQRRVLFREVFRVLKPTGLLSVYPSTRSKTGHQENSGICILSMSSGRSVDAAFDPMDCTKRL